jgi:hypothetical protein
MKFSDLVVGTAYRTKRFNDVVVVDKERWAEESVRKQNELTGRWYREMEWRKNPKGMFIRGQVINTNASKETGEIVLTDNFAFIRITQFEKTFADWIEDCERAAKMVEWRRNTAMAVESARERLVDAIKIATGRDYISQYTFWSNAELMNELTDVLIQITKDVATVDAKEA